MTNLAQLLSIKQGESRTAIPVIGVMLFTSMGAALGGTGIEALFFARFGVEYLPYMYIGLGITSMLTSFVIIGALGRIPQKVLYIAVPFLIAVLIIVARLALLTGVNALYPILWLGKEILNSVISLVVWGLASAVFDARQAKRLFPLFNASRIFGQVVGGFVTGVLVVFIGTENLLIVWSGLTFIAFLLVRVVLGRQSVSSAPQAGSRRRQPTLLEEMGRGYQYVRGSSLLTWISISTILFSILYFSIALPFSRVATGQFPNENSLAAFLGLFNGFSTAAAFLASLFLANRLFARIGIMACILALPVIYLVGFGGLALAPIFAVIVAFRFAQTLWLAGIADPAWQAMFNVVPPERREQVRAFISIPEQAGTFIAGGILVVGEQALAPQQLYFVGLFTAAVCVYVIHRARHGYTLSLIEALRAGRPHLFFSTEQPFGGFQQDITAGKTALAGLRDPDPGIRRVSAEVLGHISLPESVDALIRGLSDSDSLVRAACIRAISQSRATHALLDIAASLSDPEPDVRVDAVTCLTVLAASSPSLVHYLTPLLRDVDFKVNTRAAVELLRIDPRNENAKGHLYGVASSTDSPGRSHAITALGEWGEAVAFDFLADLFDNESADRKPILSSLVQIDPLKALPFLLTSLKDPSLQVTAARLTSMVGKNAIEPLLLKLNEPEYEEGVLSALEHLPAPPAKPLEEYARLEVEKATAYDMLMRQVNSEVGSRRAGNPTNAAMGLLSEALHEKAHRHGIHALKAIGLMGGAEAMELAIENLQTREAAQRANVLETLDSISAKWRDIIQPLTRIWEDDISQAGAIQWERILADEDELIRDCAVFAKNFGESNMESLTTLSIMERILFLKRVPLFTDLPPSDLKQIASIAVEEVFPDGEMIASQGEPGDMMFMITSGEVRVCMTRDGIESEVARRKAGDYVGEMSIINRVPRIATLIAVNEVRALCIDQKSFEGLLRDRPDVSLNVIKELSKRLKEASEKINV
jgi:HEAT repeat protein